MIDKKIYANYTDAGYSIIPLVREVEARGDTPISLYLKVANQKNTFLLESVEGGEKWAQYSIIGFDCIDSVSPQDSHPGKESHKLYASKIANVLKTKGKWIN